VSPSLKMIMASPGSEHLLWLPDLVCSAYRRRLFGQTELFDEISAMTHVVQLP